MTGGANSYYLGGLCGTGGRNISNCFWDIETSGMSTSSGGTGKSTAQMKAQSTFTDAGWNFTDIWWITQAIDYPKLIQHSRIAYNGQLDISLGPDEYGMIQINVYSASNDPMGWRVTGFGSCSWIVDVQPSSGSSTGPDDITQVDINIDTIGLDNGTYTCNVQLTADSGYSIVLPITLHVTLSGSGTEIDPYLITSLSDFNEFAGNSHYWDGYTRLDTDIDLTGQAHTTAVIAPDVDNSNWTFDGTPFAGVFDGNGHTISNLAIDSAGAENYYLGLFGSINGTGAEVKNLGIEDCNITGEDYSNYLGGLCGENNGTISNCYVTGEVSGGFLLGGLCGNNTNNGTITNCQASGVVTGGDYSSGLGGLCGGNGNNGSIRDSYATGTVTGGVGSKQLGGLCGVNGGSINDCNAIGAVTGYEYLGGLCGINVGTISDCYSTGAVTGGNDSAWLGGLCGYNHNTITNSHSTSDVSGGDNSYYLGGLCGRNYQGTITGCHAGGAVTGDDELGGLCGNSYLGIINDCSATGAVVGRIGSWGLGGLCGSSNYGSISNCYATGTITGSDESYDLGGLCGWSEDIITNSYATGAVTGGNDSSGLGGLCGNNYFGTISNCYAIGTVTGVNNSYQLGGLCGNNRGSINDCYATGAITGEDNSEGFGGLCGENDSGGIITNCYATGAVTSGNISDELGGLCGDNFGVISNCFWDTETSGMATSDGGIGKTTAEMQMQSTFTDAPASWDFVGEDVNGYDDTWRLCLDGTDYPRLAWEFGSDYSCPDGVSTEDLLYLSTYWLESDLEPYTSADRTGDGVVDLEEYALLAEQWLKEE